MMMVSKSMKVLNIIAGVLLMALGVYCLCNQDIAAMTAGDTRFSDAISSMLRCCRWYSDCICDAISGSNCAR